MRLTDNEICPRSGTPTGVTTPYVICPECHRHVQSSMTYKYLRHGRYDKNALARQRYSDKIESQPKEEPKPRRRTKSEQSKE
jgi:hypothetical protein